MSWSEPTLVSTPTVHTGLQVLRLAIVCGAHVCICRTGLLHHKKAIHMLCSL